MDSPHSSIAGQVKDASVAPVGLLDTSRQRRLLDGMARRYRSCVEQQETLQARQAKRRIDEEKQLADERSRVTASCRQKRRAMLDHWDQVEEQLISQYEAGVLQHHTDLSRLNVVYRRKMAEEKEAIERKVEARRQAVFEQYENGKNFPGQQRRKEHSKIEAAMNPIGQDLELARTLTVRRLDRLPEVGSPEVNDQETRPAVPRSVPEALEAIGQLSGEARKIVKEMQSGVASRIVDSYLLPSGVAMFVAVWMIAAYFVAPQPKLMWMAAGILPAGVIGFLIYLILLWPVKRLTRRLYPKIERIGQTAEKFAAAGRHVSAKRAAELSAELVGRRDTQLESARQWKHEQFEELEHRLKSEQEARRTTMTQSAQQSDRDYTESYHRIGSEMRDKAESLAASISQELESTDHSIQQRREASAAERFAQLQRVAHRLNVGVRRGLERIASSVDRVQRQFPDWEDIDFGRAADLQGIDFLPLGVLRVDETLQRWLAPSFQEEKESRSGDNGATLNEEVVALLADTNIPRDLPVVLHRRRHSGVVIDCPRTQIDRAIDLAHQLLWRLLTGAAPGRAKLTLIDPLGRGQHFTSFMALADHDPSLVGHRVWTTDSKIETRLEELAQHVEDVLQASLRDRFERIEDYNQKAGSMAEPYRAVAAVGLPDGLSREGYKHLKALLESGLRCGVFSILVCDDSQPWPVDMPLPSGDHILRLQFDESGSCRLQSPGLQELAFEPASPPPASLRSNLIQQIGKAAVAAARVEIPLDNILSAAEEGKGSTDDDIAIAIGSQGADRVLRLQLGQGVKQHVLIAGKTGSGKSTLLHSVITSGAHHYRPDQLQFYLLDFKKGVEFKPYADTQLPHARVIGIESEREFGRSVLQRLDDELQQRGEKFRAAGVQELSDFREATGESLPRIILVVDEFQELFVRDDRLAGDCSLLLDRLVRQGRSFGMHVILSSQSLAGAYSLPRATLGQMAVRIAMQCSESDAALILADDNTAARLISRPGEAIYNDAGGLVEGNQPFQVARLTGTRHREMLNAITARDDAYCQELSPAVIFEGNRPCRWSAALANASLANRSSNTLCGLLGEAVEIGPPVTVELSRTTGRNVLLITPGASRGAILAAALAGMAKSDPRLEVIYLEGSRADDAKSLAPWLEEIGISIRTVRPRDSEAEIIRLNELVQSREEDTGDAPPIVVVIDPLERFRDLRQEESFNFSLDAPGAIGAGVAFQTLLREGPACGVSSILACGSAETMGRWLPRASQHDLEIRIVGRMNQSDSSLLIDSPMAADLSEATMLLYDDADGRLTKFRQCDLPDAPAVRDWLHAASRE